MSDEERAYKDLIAGSSSEEELSENEDEDGDENGQGGKAEAKLMEQKRIEEMRLKLLGGLASTKNKPVKNGGDAGF